jgi:hypothetical protein
MRLDKGHRRTRKAPGRAGREGEDEEGGRDMASGDGNAVFDHITP